MRNLFLIFGLLLSYTFLYTGASKFGTDWFAFPVV